ncbi:MAG: EF2563 family selenium-dependent molybdenum hydroxylase system protein [Clostridia bacterium]|nr:EF2563 family selenium-dependent molybdenum hydroxylase system protein [Clostridia bacterium]
MRILIRGAGDLATGVAWELFQRGHDVLMTEVAEPLAVRRLVSFSRAVYEGSAETDGVHAVLARSLDEALSALGRREIPVMVDKQAAVRESFGPDVLVDGIMAKHNLGTRRTDAPLVIALGPGFTAGEDCDVVIETQRGETLGMPIWSGSALPNTGVPGNIGGCTTERLLRSAGTGRMEPLVSIGDPVEKGQVVARTGGEPVRAQISGVVRGLLQEGVRVSPGLKIGDVDPRRDAELCYHISDKAHRIGEGAAEAVSQRFS